MSIRDQDKSYSTVKTRSYTVGTLRAPAMVTASTGLDADQVYTSGWIDAYNYNSVRGLVYMSGSDGVAEPIAGSFVVQQSSNASIVQYTSSVYSASNDAAVTFDETLYTRYTQLVFTNNATSGSAADTTGSFVVDSYLIP